MNTAESAKGRRAAKRRGSAMVTSLIVILVAMTVTGSLFAMSAAMPRRVRRMTDAIRAKTIAEAGINRAYSLLRDGYAEGLSAFPLDSSFAGGHYEVALVPLAGNEARLVSVGQFGSATARVGADVRNAAGFDPAGGGGPGGAYAHALFANGDLTFNGTPKSIRGSLHTNNDFTLNGVYTNVEGMIFARNAAVIPQAHRGDWRPIPFPKLDDPDFAAFIEAARAAGILTEFHQTTTTFPRNHIYNGVVVVRGNLTHNGSGTRTVNGLLYVTGSVTFNGSSGITVNGALLAGGNITFNGASSTTSEFELDGTHLPPGGEEAADHVVIDAWWE